jgi:ATP-dependent RNA helicase RhlE
MRVRWRECSRRLRQESIILKEFENLGLVPETLRPLEQLGYRTPTPIQRDAIPLLLAGRDLLGLAQTGTGKTAAFGLPLLQMLKRDDKRPEPRCVSALIVAPTRELANQISDSLRGFAGRSHLRIRRVVGGASINIQCRDLQRGADILVATPGRLLDLVKRNAVRIDSARYLVLDEADQMLDLGFIQPLRQIAKLVGTPRQTMLFSATMPKQIESLAAAFLTDPARVQTAPTGRAADKIDQSVHFVRQSDKAALLKSMLSENADDLSLVFARTKHGAEKLMKHLVAAGFGAASIHGNKSQNQRERAIRAFREGEIRVLVATDVAARGIDIPGVSHVYNHDLPEVAESYVHRIGRTARAGAEGKAISLCTPDEVKLLRSIEKLMGMAVTPAGGDALHSEPAGGRKENSGRPFRDRRRPRRKPRPSSAGAPSMPKRNRRKNRSAARKSA